MALTVPLEKRRGGGGANGGGGRSPSSTASSGPPESSSKGSSSQGSSSKGFSLPKLPFPKPPPPPKAASPPQPGPPVLFIPSGLVPLGAGTDKYDQDYDEIYHHHHQYYDSSDSSVSTAAGEGGIGHCGKSCGIGLGVTFGAIAFVVILLILFIRLRRYISAKTTHIRQKKDIELQSQDTKVHQAPKLPKLVHAKERYMPRVADLRSQLDSKNPASRSEGDAPSF